MAFDGQIVQIPLGEAGLSGSHSVDGVAPDELVLANNVSFENGQISKEGGATRFNSSALASGARIIAGHDWWPTVSTQRTIVQTSTGVILKDSGLATFPTTLVSGLSTTATHVPQFVEAGAEALGNNRKLVMFNGYNTPYVLAADGATMSALATPAADWSGNTQPSCGCNHDGRLWAALGHRVYYSMATNHEDFTGTGSGSIAIYPGVGEKIVHIRSYKGLVVVWKYPYGVFAIDTTDATPANWIVVQISPNIGMVGVHGCCQTENEILFMDTTGNLQLLSGVQEFGSLGTKNLSRTHWMNQWIKDNIAFSQLYNARMVYYAAKREVHIALAETGETTNTVRLVVDFNRDDLVRFRTSDRDVCESLWLYKYSTDNSLHLASGNATGYVYQMDQTTRSKDNAGYTGEFQTAHTDFSFVDASLGPKRKLGRFLEISGEALGDWDLSCQIIWDGRVVQTVTFPMDLPSSGTLLNARRRRIVGSGRRLSLRFYNSGAAQNFSVSRAWLHFHVGDERTKAS